MTRSDTHLFSAAAKYLRDERAFVQDDPSESKKGETTSVPGDKLRLPVKDELILWASRLA